VFRAAVYRPIIIIIIIIKKVKIIVTLSIKNTAGALVFNVHGRLSVQELTCSYRSRLVDCYFNELIKSSLIAC